MVNAYYCTISVLISTVSMLKGMKLKIMPPALPISPQHLQLSALLLTPMKQTPLLPTPLLQPITLQKTHLQPLPPLQSIPLQPTCGYLPLGSLSEGVPPLLSTTPPHFVILWFHCHYFHFWALHQYSPLEGVGVGFQSLLWLHWPHLLLHPVVLLQQGHPLVSILVGHPAG